MKSLKRVLAKFRKWLRYKRDLYAHRVLIHLVNKAERRTLRIQKAVALKNAREAHATERKGLEARLNEYTKRRLSAHDRKYEKLCEEIVRGGGR